MYGYLQGAENEVLGHIIHVIYCLVGPSFFHLICTCMTPAFKEGMNKTPLKPVL